MSAALSVQAQTTEFTYQGSLKNASSPATGNYDFEFALYDAVLGGAQIGSTLTRASVAVADGNFTVKLDFGSQFPGANRFIEIRVRQTGGGAYTPLAPRQQVNSAPYSVKAVNADNAVNATNAAQLGGMAANQYVLTGDPRLSDARNPLAGSGNYIQNQNAAPQAASNFNISGNGTAGGLLSGNIVNATTQYNIGGSRIFGAPGTGNLFAGFNAGQSNTSGTQNSFFGQGSGTGNTTGGFNAFFGQGSGFLNNGNDNSFFGVSAGGANTSGSDNSFFGLSSGFNNNTGGSNSFFGHAAGGANTTGSNNTMLGSFANVGGPALTNATAIGANAIVNTSNTIALGRASGADTVQIPGNLNVGGTFTGNINGAGITNLNASNIATGTLNNARLGIVPVANGGTGSATQNFVDLTNSQTIGGDKTFSNMLWGNTVNSSTQYSIGGIPVLSAAGVDNFFAGGSGSSTGFGNAFFGKGAGQQSTGGNDNTFVGAYAGQVNAQGSFNSFFGKFSGASNFGNSNSFFGHNAGSSNTTGSRNTLIGTLANVGSGNLTFATALGSDAVVNTSNTVVLGRNVDTVQIPGNLQVTGGDVRWSNSLLQQQQGGSIELGGTNTIAGTGIPFVDFHFNGLIQDFNVRLINDIDGKLSLVGSLQITDKIQLGNLGAAGANTLCRNAGNEISTCSSSRRYKSNISAFDPGLSLIRQLRPVSFNWKDGGMADMGLVAEEVAAIEPLLTTYNAKGEVEGVKYDRIGVVLLNAVNEQQAQIEAQQRQNDIQQKQIDEQRTTIKRQQAEIEALKKLACLQNPTAEICQPKIH